jgi:hypothetical protein
MASDFAEFCLYVQRLQTKIARYAIWINIPAALLNFILVQLNNLGFLSIYVRPTPVRWTLSLQWLVVSVVPLMLLAEFREMWWNPFAKNAYPSQSCKMSENRRQRMLEGNRRVVKRAFDVAVRRRLMSACSRDVIV